MRLRDRNRDVHNIVLLAIVCLVLQLALAPNIALLQGHANFACIFAMLIALSIGGRTGTICGFIAGILYDLSSTSPIGLMALLLTVMSYILGREVHNRLSGNFGSSVGKIAISVTAVSVVQQVFSSILGQTANLMEALGFIAFPTIILTVVFFLPFAYRYSRSQSSNTSLGKERNFRGVKRAAKHLR